MDRDADLAAGVRALSPQGVDAALHLAGDGQQGAGLVKPGGRFASTLGLGAEQLETPDVAATAVMAMPTAEALSRLGAEVAGGRLRVPIRRTYRLEDVPQAIADFAQGTLGKIAIVIGE